jgi:hypothetical protein
MKKTLLAAFIFSVFFSFSSSPNYNVSPALVTIATAPANQTSIFDTYMNNLAAGQIKLKWELISSQIPSGWDYSICDYGTCYPGIPDSGQMSFVEVAGQGFLGLNLNPYALSGTAVVKIFVYENGFYSIGDTISWYITSDAVGIGEKDFASRISLFPNPANEAISISIPGISENTYSYDLTDAKGAIVYSGLAASASFQVNISAFEPGIYFLKLYCDHPAVIASREFLAVKKLVKL